MKEQTSEKKKDSFANNVIIGILLFFAVIIAVLIAGKVWHYLSDKIRYGDIYDIAEKHGLKIEDIDSGQLRLAGLSFTEGKGSDTMQKVFDFAKELESYMNDHTDKFGDDVGSFSIRAEQDPGMNDVILASSTKDDEYSFDSYRLIYRTDISKIGFLKDAEELYFSFEADDISGIEAFGRLKHLSMPVKSEEKREKLRQALPECEFDFGE